MSFIFSSGDESFSLLRGFTGKKAPIVVASSFINALFDKSSGYRLFIKCNCKEVLERCPSSPVPESQRIPHASEESKRLDSCASLLLLKSNISKMCKLINC